MKPHPRFQNWTIPERYTLGSVNLKSLTIHDMERDYSAIMESAADFKAAHPGMSWPDDLTREQNLIDLAWHQKEFSARRSFAWVIQDTHSNYLGCLYVYPSIAGDDIADVRWWWRTGAHIDARLFRKNLINWLNSPSWPELNFLLPITSNDE